MLPVLVCMQTPASQTNASVPHETPYDYKHNMEQLLSPVQTTMFGTLDVSVTSLGSAIWWVFESMWLDATYQGPWRVRCHMQQRALGWQAAGPGARIPVRKSQHFTAPSRQPVKMSGWLG